MVINPLFVVKFITPFRLYQLERTAPHLRATFSYRFNPLLFLYFPPVALYTFASFTFQARFALHQLAFTFQAIGRNPLRCKMSFAQCGLELVSNVRANCVSMGNKRLRRYDIGQPTDDTRPHVCLFHILIHRRRPSSVQSADDEGWW